MHEGEHQADLLPVALGQLAHRAVGHDLEAVDQPVRQAAAAGAAGAGEPGDVLAAGQPGEELEIAGQVADTAAGLGAARGGIEPQEQGAALGRPRKAISIRIVVDFPAPLGPRKPKTWPGSIRRLRSATAVTLP